MARKGQATVLTLDELGQLWHELAQPHRAIAKLCYYTASRISEVVRLQAGDIRSKVIHVRMAKRKDDAVKTIAIAPALQAALDEYGLPEAGFLFPAAHWARATRKQYRIDRKKRNGKNHFDLVAELPPAGHISTAAVNRAITNAASVLGLEGVSSHSFRRSMATHLYRDGVPLRTIMGITGHEGLASLTRYLALEEKAAFDVLSNLRW